MSKICLQKGRGGWEAPSLPALSSAAALFNKNRHWKMGKNKKDPGPAITGQVSDMLKLSHMPSFTVMGLKINSFVLLFVCFLYSADQKLNLCVRRRCSEPLGTRTPADGCSGPQRIFPGGGIPSQSI